MKKIFYLKFASSMLIFFFFLSFNLFAQGGAPKLMNYQAVARNTGGALISNQAISVRFTIHSVSAVGAIEYQETQNLTTNQYGLFTALIGNGTVTSGTWSGINLEGADQYLQVEFDPAGGVSYINMGASQLVSVPYALSAANSYWSTNGVDIQNINAGNVVVGGTMPGIGKFNVTPASGQNGIYVGDPVDGLSFFSVKSGLGEGIYMEKTDLSTGTPAIEGVASGANAAVSGIHNNSGTGVSGSSVTGTGIYGFVSDPAGLAGKFDGRLAISFAPIQNNGVVDHSMSIDGQASTYYPGISLYSSNNAIGVTLFGQTITSNALNVGSFDGQTYADVNANAFNVLSDSRAKKDIDKINAPVFSKYMDYIRNIQSATFWYNSESKLKRTVPHIGLIAQTLPVELQAKVFDKPGGGNTEERIAVSLADLAGLTLIGVKALDEKQAAFEQTIKSQQQEIELLKNQLKAIQNKLDQLK